MPEPVWTRSIRNEVAVTRVMLPLYLELGSARLTRVVFQATRGARRKVLLTAAGATVMAALVLLKRPLGAALLAPFVFGPAATRLFAWVRRKGQLYFIAKGDLPTAGLPSAAQTLRELGLDEAAAQRLIAAAGIDEVKIAAFDQENRVCSDVGPIPFFEGVEIAPEHFRKRNRHLLELVLFRNVVCVKKVYRDFLSFEIELLALNALGGIAGVPRVVGVRLWPPIVYQTFIVGRNLGSLMTPHGAPDEVQDQVSVDYWGGDRWRDNPVSPARSAAIAAVSAAVPAGTVAGIGRLMDRIHQRGVTITDVKYGNVLMVGDEPHFCDFDRATVYHRNSWPCLMHRASDREMFNYFFGGEQLTERRFRPAAGQLLDERPGLGARRIYVGHGYETPGEGSLEQGSGAWRRIRSRLPDLGGQSILDLGGTDGLFALEMLRAGARRVTTREGDRIVARYARLNHRWFEFVDNRAYAGFELLEGPAEIIRDRDWKGYDMATAFAGLDLSTPEEVGRLVQTLSRDIDCLVVRARPSVASEPGALRDLLASNGYPNQTVLPPGGDEGPLLVGRRSDS